MKKKTIIFLLLTIIGGISFLTFSCGNSKKNDLKKNIMEKQNGEIKSEIKLKYLAKNDVEVTFWNSKKISDKQAENLAEFGKHEKELTEKIKLAIFEYYKSVYDDYKSGIDLANVKLTKKQLEEILPIPTTPEKLFEKYQIGNIHIQDNKNCK